MPPKPFASSTPVPKETIKNLRSEIDQVDDQILLLLHRRARLAREIGEAKKKLGPGEARSDAIPFFDPEREQAIIDRLTLRARADEAQALAECRPASLLAQQESPAPAFPAASVGHVYKEIVSACRSLEASFRVAYLGPPGTYT